MLDRAPECVFGNINSFINDSARDVLLSEGHRLRTDDLVQIFTSHPNAVLAEAPCVAHGRSC
eukprot:2779986-Alexandrium_andersonii.AAC.1